MPPNFQVEGGIFVIKVNYVMCRCSLNCIINKKIQDDRKVLKFNGL